MEKPANAPYCDDFRSYGNDEKQKKERKWTLGGFFRRKVKKEDDSSQEEEEDRGFLGRKRSGRKPKTRANGFDVVVATTAEELWSGSSSTKEPQQQQRYIFRQHDTARIESNLSRNSSGGSGSLDSRKGRREVMARAQAKRDQMRDGSSSDDDYESGQSSCSASRRRRPGRASARIPSATPSPTRSPRVQPKMPLHGSASYPLPIHTYPPPVYAVAHSPSHRRTLLEYEQFIASCKKSMSYDQDMHRAEAMFVQLPIARTRSSGIQAEAHGQVPNPKPEPPPRMRPVATRFDSTSSLPLHPTIQRSCSGSFYENIHPMKTTVHYTQSSPKASYPRIPQSPPTDLRYYADQNPRSRNPIHITYSPTNEQPYLSDSQLSRKSTKEFWRMKDQEVMMKKQQQQQRSRSNSPALTCVVNKPKPRQTAVVVARKIIEPAKMKTPPEPPIRRHSKIDLPAITQSTSNLDEALNELESIYKSLKLTEDHGTPVKQKPPKSPDRIADDMAVRRLAVKDTTVESRKLVQQSYLQSSPILGPPVKSPAPEPDITLDDVVYRNHRYAMKTPDPQPPFGIPIGPVAPAADSDYLHVNPTEKLRNSFLASKVPDIVKDDLAFRNLRKDNLTANLPKKRAVRSLSENLFNILHKDETLFLPIETNNNNVDNGYDKTQSMTDLNENLQRDSFILEKRLKALKEEKSAKRAEFFHQDKTPVHSLLELRQDNQSRQRSTSTETLTEDNERKSRQFRSPVIELSKYPAAVPANVLLSQNPFKEQPAPLDESQLDDLLSKIAREAKITSEAIGRQLVELEVAVVSPERKLKLNSIEMELRKNDDDDDVKIIEVKVEPPPVTHKVSFTSNLSQILAQVEQEHSAFCKAFPSNDTNDEKIAVDHDEIITTRDFSEISDVADIIDSDDGVAAKSDVFEQVYEYNCALLNIAPPTNATADPSDATISVGDEVKRIAATRGPDSDRGEHSRPRGADPFGPDCDAGMNRRSSELTSSSGSSDAARERIERYKDRRRQELSARYGSRSVADTARSPRLEKDKTDPISTNKTEPRCREQQGVRETKASRLRAASLTNRIETEKIVKRGESVDKSQARKSFLNRSHTSEPTKQDSSTLLTSGRKSASASGSVTNGHHTNTTTPTAKTRKSSHENEKSAIIKNGTTAKRVTNGVQSPRNPSEPKQNGNSHDEENPQKPSILKKKSLDESSGGETSPRPVSILKRKTLSQDGAVTFSPSVVEREENRKKPGILKKRRSLDESHVNRERSLSPDKSILKNQRRLSMEDVNVSLNEPHGILKRKSATPPLHHHVTIADTVIMAAAAALGDVQPNFEHVRPILKKKNSSEDHTPEIPNFVDPPRPILKKKSVEVEDVLLVRPILKSSRKSSDDELPSILKNNERVRARSVCGYERAKPRILPRPLSLAESGTDFHNFLRNELDWLTNGDAATPAVVLNPSNGISACKENGNETDDALSKLSVSDRIGLFNTKNVATPAPATRRPRAARFKTQPVTGEELIQVRPPGGVLVLPLLKGILKRNTTGSGSESSDSEVKTILANSREPTDLARILRDVNQEAERSGSSIVKSQSHSSVAKVLSKKKEVDKDKDEDGEKEVGLKRSTTQPLGHLSSKDEGEDMSGKSIKERLAKLRQSGENGWVKRNTRLKNPDEVSVITTGNYLFNGGGESQSVLAARLDQLDTARESWKTRVPQTDAVKFTVEGKMGLPVSSPAESERKKRSPKQIKFRSRNFVAELHSSPASPDVANSATLRRSLSAPGGDDLLASSPPPVDGPVVAVPKTEDTAFEAFFSSVLRTDERLDFPLADLDVIQRSESSLLVQRRTIQVQRRRRTARNPVKSLALRSDLLDVYREVKTGVAEKELRRMKGEKMGSLAMEALAGLASTEDFTAVNLRRPTSGPVFYPDVMLLRIKGRRHVETRLVEPVPNSVNNGDCFVAVTRDAVALFMGELSNVVEKARAKEVAARIEAGELACAAARVSGAGRFWDILGGGGYDAVATEAGPPDEDEKIEACLAATNMVFELVDHELVPVTDVWGSVPKIEILRPNKNLVFDFGTEMYVWSGRSASLTGRREAAILAKEMWDEGFDYGECEWSPYGELKGERPSWALFCKITQNMEPVTFREKFQDWPDLAVAAAKNATGTSEPDGSTLMEIRQCDAERMMRERLPWPDLKLEGTHLGRGVNYLDEETRRLSEISDVGVAVWRVSEANHHELTGPRDFGQFREDSSYVIRWHYSVAVTVRDLKGAPSRHTAPGRDRFAYFLWHGRHSSPGDRGAAALHTVTLDTESAPQIVVPQFSEPPAFLRLFKGTMGVHRPIDTPVSVYLVRGSEKNETVSVEVEPVAASLRSRACFVIINRDANTLTLWHGSQASDVTKEMARITAEHIVKIRPKEYRLPETDSIAFREIDDGAAEMDLPNDLPAYFGPIDGTPMRLFAFGNTRGEFEACEIASPLLHPDGSFPYLFLQSDLYAVSQPGIFLLDAGDKLWLWHGWIEPDTTAPSTVVRHQAQRRAAMQTAVRYWELSRNESQQVRGCLVWAGLEPPEFQALFPFWEPREDVTEFNLKETNREIGVIVDMETELERLMCMRYPLAVLLQRPLPDGVDPTQLEDYLEPDAFPQLFEMSRREFMELPSWKKNTLKKDIGLF